MSFVNGVWGTPARKTGTDMYTLSCRGSGDDTDDFTDGDCSEYANTSVLDDERSVALSGAYYYNVTLSGRAPDDDFDEYETAPRQIVAEGQLRETSKSPARWNKNTLLLFAVVMMVCVAIAATVVVVDRKLDAANRQGGTTTPTDPFAQCQIQEEITTLGEGVQEVYIALKTSLLRDHLDSDMNITSCEPANKALVWLALDYTQDQNSTKLSSSVLTRFALAFAYASMGGEEWIVQDNWLGPDHECTWHGVTCDDEGNIDALSLPANMLRGTLESRLGLLPNLRILDLSHNDIGGTIPFDAWAFSSLEALFLGQNKLEGTLPKALGGLEFATSLEELSLFNNQINGPMPDVSGLTNLAHLDFSSTLLNGTFPMEGLDQLTSLQVLNLVRMVAIQGTLSSSLTSLTNLRQFTTSGAYLYGTIPETIGNMESLEFLYVGDAHLTGTIPTTLGNLTKLIELELHGNSFSGSLPTELGACTNLEFFDGSENAFLVGSIPSEVANCTKLEFFLVSSTSLTGTVPPGFEKMTGLEELTVQCSRITAPLPSAICDEQPYAIIRSDEDQQANQECSCCKRVSETMC